MTAWNNGRFLAAVLVATMALGCGTDRDSPDPKAAPTQDESVTTPPEPGGVDVAPHSRAPASMTSANASSFSTVVARARRP